MWQNWVNAVLGLWVIAVPFLGFSAAALTWTLVVSGIIIAAVAIWDASVEASEHQHIAELENRLAHQRG